MKTVIKIEKILAKFEFVRWDRFVEDIPAKELSFYGWIERKQDKYKDFIVLKICTKDFYTDFITSSALWDKEICKILKVLKRDQLKCQRVEHNFSVPNSIKLKNKAWDEVLSEVYLT